MELRRQRSERDLFSDLLEPTTRYFVQLPRSGVLEEQLATIENPASIGYGIVEFPMLTAQHLIGTRAGVVTYNVSDGRRLSSQRADILRQ